MTDRQSGLTTWQTGVATPFLFLARIGGTPRALLTSERQVQQMEMLVMGFALSLVGTVVACIAFGAATASERQEPENKIQPQIVVKPVAPQFFGTHAPVSDHMQVPLEALLLQIESHVRLEQAAAESFLYQPTAALLHSRTASPLIH